MWHPASLNLALSMVSASPLVLPPAPPPVPVQSLPLIDSDGGISVPLPGGGDEIRPVAAGPLIGKAYPGKGLPAEIQFINVRPRSVRLNWIDRDGVLRFYAVIPSGGELLQPTFVSHRWVITPDQIDASGSRTPGRTGGFMGDSAGPLEAFIATRSNVHGVGSE